MMDIPSWTSLSVPDSPFLRRVQVFINTLRSVRYLSAGHSSCLHSTFRAHARCHWYGKRRSNGDYTATKQRSIDPSFLNQRGGGDRSYAASSHITSFSRVGIGFFFAMYRSNFRPERTQPTSHTFSDELSQSQIPNRALDWDWTVRSCKMGASDVGRYRSILLPGLRKAGRALRLKLPQNKAGAQVLLLPRSYLYRLSKVLARDELP